MKNWLLPERPGPLVGLHIISSGYGTALADRWPDPRSLLVETGGNYSLSGDPGVLDSGELRAHIKGFVETEPGFLTPLKEAFPELQEWQRVIFTQSQSISHSQITQGKLNRLSLADAKALSKISEESAWIWNTWGGPEELASSGFSWGVYVERRLVSVACTFFLGERFEDVGVVTDPVYRNQGFSSACAGALCRDIHARGRIPSWTTSPDNTASLGVARRLGFTLQREDVLYVAGVEIPVPN
jgi:GNAT superfamily N-acetyltransferase